MGAPSLQETVEVQENMEKLQMNVKDQRHKPKELPPFIKERQVLFDKLKGEQDEHFRSLPRNSITINLPGNVICPGTSYETTPMELFKEQKLGNLDEIVICKVNGKLWDMTRPLEEDSTIEFLKFDSAEGQRVFWHSSAHILGEASELVFDARLCVGPPTTEGFFYEMALDGTVVSQTDFPEIEAAVKKFVKEKQPFERLVISKENLLKMFEYNKYKQYLIQTKVPDGSSTTIYRCGHLIDLCAGPHVPHTGYVKNMMVTKSSASYFLGDAKNDQLQRIYGISFPLKEQMVEYKNFVKEAQKRDHRLIGRQQELFFFDEMSPGSCFFLPKGAKIYNTLLEFIRSEYWKRGYQEVITPNMFNVKLWQTSGHWQNYAENMFSFKVEKDMYALKPMNCPSHCLMFKHRDRSYRELPMRYADFGVLHRNEFSGALSGLTRVRRFCQDDAHVFCAQDQVKGEIMLIFDFLKHVYEIFGFTFKMVLSTRPEKYLGEIAVWDNAEKQLENALNEFGANWEFNHGDGAFYGPKIDITVSDALRRQHQCATIQLDFQLPERFELEFTGKNDSTERPVIIHRAVYGSLERFIAILTEHYGGKWPFWLSPRQVMIVPVAEPFYEYSQSVSKRLHDLEICSEVDTSANTFSKKVRNAQVAQWNVILVVGENEVKANAVNVRLRENQTAQEMVPVDEFIDRIVKLRETKA